MNAPKKKPPLPAASSHLKSASSERARSRGCVLATVGPFTEATIVCRCSCRISPRRLPGSGKPDPTMRVSCYHHHHWRSSSRQRCSRTWLWRFAPTAFTAVMITTEMPAAIRPYSIAVAPELVFQKSKHFGHLHTPCDCVHGHSSDALLRASSIARAQFPKIRTACRQARVVTCKKSLTTPKTKYFSMVLR